MIEYFDYVCRWFAVAMFVGAFALAVAALLIAWCSPHFPRSGRDRWTRPF